MKIPKSMKLDRLDFTILFVLAIVGLIAMLSFCAPKMSIKPELQAGIIQQIYKTGGARFVRLTAIVKSDDGKETLYVEEPLTGFAGCKVGDHLYLRRNPSLSSGYQFIQGSCLS